jgi:aspartyl-tRNA synthetase
LITNLVNGGSSIKRQVNRFLTGQETIREVIAFPKNNHASEPMTDAPAIVDKEQLTELGVTVKEVKDE